MIRRILAVGVVVALVVAGGALSLSRSPPDARAVGAADAVGVYVLKLRGDGFDRSATSGRASAGTVRGRALLTVSRTSPGGDPRDLTVRVTLDGSLKDSLLDRATPTPALLGRGVLVEDSLTVIGAGQSNFVNALTLRFLKSGKKIEGWWLASFPGSDAAEGFVAGVGLTFRGKQQRKASAAAVAAATR